VSLPEKCIDYMLTHAILQELSYPQFVAS
jgi:hypothetical protein